MEKQSIFCSIRLAGSSSSFKTLSLSEAVWQAGRWPIDNFLSTDVMIKKSSFINYGIRKRGRGLEFITT